MAVANVSVIVVCGGDQAVGWDGFGLYSMISGLTCRVVWT